MSCTIRRVLWADLRDRAAHVPRDAPPRTLTSGFSQLAKVTFRGRWWSLLFTSTVENSARSGRTELRQKRTPGRRCGSFHQLRRRHGEHHNVVLVAAPVSIERAAAADQQQGGRSGPGEQGRGQPGILGEDPACGHPVADRLAGQARHDHDGATCQGREVPEGADSRNCRVDVTVDDRGTRTASGNTLPSHHPTCAGFSGTSRAPSRELTNWIEVVTPRAAMDNRLGRKGSAAAAVAAALTADPRWTGAVEVRYLSSQVRHGV